MTSVNLSSDSQFKFQMSLTGANVWFIVDKADVGATNFDRIHSDFITALVKGCNVWISAFRLEANSKNHLTSADIYNSCLYH
ncbi:MAG: hypothetical protein JF616_13335 [Fibrobacteres bacterium]|nr:hypothetical protein [Fibrobacterota bacterium]